MTTLSAVRKIKAGLALRPGTNTNYESLADVVGSPLTFPDLGKLVDGVLSRRTAMKQKAEIVTKRLAVFEKNRAVELNKQGKTFEPRGDGSHIVNDLWNDNARKIQPTADVKAKRRELTKEIANSRAEAMGGVANSLALLKLVRSSWEDPVALLPVLEVNKADAEIDGKPTASLNLKIGLKRKEVATWAGDEELAAAVGEENE